MLSEGKVVMPSRTVMWVKGNWWGIMQAYVPNHGVGVKIVNVIPKNVERGLPTIQALVTLFDEDLGSPLAVIEGSVLTALRTAAASALSIKYLAPTEGSLGIIGTGYQARYQLRFALEYFKAHEVKIYDVRPKAMEGFKRYAREELGIDVTVCKNSDEVVKGASLIIEASTTKEPVIHGRYLSEPVHVVSIGAHTPESRAIDDDAIKLANYFVVDYRKAVLEETGDVIIPVKEGLLNINKVCELGELVSGKCVVRKGEGVSIYKSVGVAIQDVCAANYAYKLATKERLGKYVEL